MWTADSDLFDISVAPQGLIAAAAEWVFDAVWRFDFSAPGSCLLDVGPAVDSHQLRASLLDLKERLSEVGSRRSGMRFVYRSLGRFDQ
jgi:hypothetical protein